MENKGGKDYLNTLSDSNGSSHIKDFETKNREARFMILMLSFALLMGALVLIFNSDYRIEKNLESNSNYYPTRAVCTKIIKHEKKVLR